MVDELRHESTAIAAGKACAKADWEDVDIHRFDSQATGDIPYASSATQIIRRAIGAAGTFLKVVGGIPAWANPYLVDLLTTRGDIVTRGAAAPQRLALPASGKMYKSDGIDVVATTSALLDDNERLAELLAGCNYLGVPINSGWTETVTGDATTTSHPMYQDVKGAATANDTALLTLITAGFHNDIADLYAWDWAKKCFVVFNYLRSASNATAIARFQLKTPNTIGAMGDKGIGIRVDNLDLMGESYGVALGVVNLNTTLTNQKSYQIVIIFYPASKIEWYVNGVLKGTQSTGNNMPTGNSANSYLAHSVNNGANATATTSRLMHPKLWQEL